MNSNPKRWQILNYLIAGTFLSPLDYFIINIALPSIKEAFHANDYQLQLVVAIYGLTYASLVVFGGRLGDIYGRKNIFITGLYTFLFSSLACAFAPTITWLIIFRLFQGIGASLLAPQVLASIKDLFTEHEHPKAVNLFSCVFGLASVVGQLLGGLLLSLKIGSFSWELVFLVNVPIAIICIIGVHFTMKNQSINEEKSIDFVGAFLLICALICIICALIFGQKYHWNYKIFIVFIFGISLLYLFLKYETFQVQKRKAFLIDPKLLKQQSFSFSLIIIFFYNFTAGLFICYPYYLQEFLHQNTIQTGFAIVPYGIAFFLAPFISSQLKFTSFKLIYLGQLLLFIGFILCALSIYFQPKPSLFANISLFIAGFGHGAIMSIMIRTAISFVSKNKAGQASGLVSISIQIGSVTGGAIIGTLFFNLIEQVGFTLAFCIAITMIGVFQLFGIIATYNLKNIYIKYLKMNNTEKIIYEIETFHKNIEKWFRGNTENKEELYHKLLAGFTTDFIMINGNGDTISLIQFSEWLPTAFGKFPERIIQLENIEVHHSNHHGLATYIETQTTGDTTTKRTSSATFLLQNNQAFWMHLIEEWL